MNMKEQPKRKWIANILLLSVILAVAMPTATAQMIEGGDHAGPTDLEYISSAMNLEPTLTNSVDEVVDCEGGVGCGGCSASCGSGQSGSCLCEGTDEQCGVWPFKKTIYSCTCTCVNPPPPPPPPPEPRICVTMSGDEVICIKNAATNDDIIVSLEPDPHGQPPVEDIPEVA